MRQYGIDAVRYLLSHGDSFLPILFTIMLTTPLEVLISRYM